MEEGVEWKEMKKIKSADAIVTKREKQGPAS
jgi:hypothetical protein